MGEAEDALKKAVGKLAEGIEQLQPAAGGEETLQPAAAGEEQLQPAAALPALWGVQFDGSGRCRRRWVFCRVNKQRTKREMCCMLPICFTHTLRSCCALLCLSGWATDLKVEAEAWFEEQPELLAKALGLIAEMER